MGLVGREASLSDVRDRLTRARLVTLVGPGGIGKTAVATTVLAEAAPSYPLGGHLVDLSRVGSAEEVRSTIAAQLGFASFGALVASPTEQPALVLVDNCEHVLEEAAAAVDALLQACESPTVLATSRSPLNLPGESVVAVGPLSLPAPGRIDLDAPAVRLLMERAGDAGVQPSADEMEHVVRLCRMLDGVPLALELAAARLAVLGPAEILARLDDLDVLARPRSRGPGRHRSLRDTIEWSYQLLAEPDRRFFDRLGIFTGPFDLDEAAAVAADGESSAHVLDHLHRLVDASLVIAERRDGRTRYRLLETLRTFARERLVASGERDDVWARYVRHVVRQTASFAADQGWRREGFHGLLDRTDAILSVLRWCLDHDDRPGRSLALTATLWGVVHQGRVDEVESVASAVLERWPDRSVAGWADAAATVATCRYLLGRPHDAVELASGALAHAGSSGYAPCTLRRVVALASCARGDLAVAIESLDAAIEHARDIPELAMELAVTRAELAANLGDVDGSLAVVRRVHEAARSAGADVNALWAHTVEASLLARVDPDQATATARHALEAARAHGYPAGESANLNTLAEIAVDQGDLVAAAGHLVELIDGLVTRGADSEVRNAIRTTASLAQRAGHEAWASLAASAAAMPVVSVFNLPGFERVSLPASPMVPLSRRDAILLARSVLHGLLDVHPVLADPVAEPAPEMAPGVEPPAGSDGANRLVRMADVWEITFASRTVAVRHSKGLDDLARLIGAAGAEVHCLDLAGAGLEERDTGETIDAQARRTYEQRIRELYDDVAEAESHNDFARAERLQAELDALVDHLSAALGLGGKARRASGTVERARSAVTHRLRGTLRRVSAAHDELGRHLAASIVTGTYCCYRPEQPTHWEIRV